MAYADTPDWAPSSRTIFLSFLPCPLIFPGEAHRLPFVCFLNFLKVYPFIPQYQKTHGGTPIGQYLSQVCQWTPPPFWHQFVTKCSFFTTLPPIFAFFGQKFPTKSSNFGSFFVNRSEKLKEKKMLKLPIFLQFHTQWPPFFGSVTQPPPFARKLSLTALWFDLFVGTPHHFLYMSAPSPAVNQS